MPTLVPADLVGMTRLSRRLKAHSTKSKALILFGLIVVVGGVGYAATSLSGSDNNATDTAQAPNAMSTEQTQAGQQGNPAENGSDDAATTGGSQAAEEVSKLEDKVVKPAPSKPQILVSRQENPVQSVTVGPGEFLVVSSGQIINNLPPHKKKRQTDCALYSGGTELASASAFNLGFENEESSVSDGSREAITMRATVKLKSPSTIALKCSPKDGRTEATMTLAVGRTG